MKSFQRKEGSCTRFSYPMLITKPLSTIKKETPHGACSMEEACLFCIHWEMLDENEQSEDEAQSL